MIPTPGTALLPWLACALLLLGLTPSPALAGRPLLVDDAGTNEAGAGHVESWYARQAGNTRVWTVAPAYAPWEGVELGAAYAREVGASLRSHSLQAKLRLGSPAEDGGWRHALVLGLSHVQRQRGPGHYASLIASRELGPGQLHLNLGASRVPGGPTLGSLGLAWEQALGPATGHVEALAQGGAKPILNLGLRGPLLPSLQLDGSLGRQDRQTLYSLGLKLQF